MTKSFRVLAWALALPAFWAANAQTPQYEAVKNFKITSNPTGSWSYLVAGSLMPDSTTAFAGVSGWNGWINDQPVPDSAAIAANKTGATIHYLTIVDPPSLLEMDPESNANVTVRFTARSTGTYAIRGGFEGIDTGELSHQVEVRHNGVAFKTATISTYGEKFTFEKELTLAAGDTLDFVNDTGGSYNNLSTGFNVVIEGPMAPAATRNPIAGGLEAR